MGTVHYIEDYTKSNFMKCDYTKSKKISKEDVKLLATLDKILSNAHELNEYWFNVYYDLKLMRQALVERLQSS